MAKKLTNDEKRKQRRKKTGEDFTPSYLTIQMLDKLAQYGPQCHQQYFTFCDPACGNGNMLVEVLHFKLRLAHDPVIALETIYGVDLMKDNVDECRMRLLKIISKHTEITDDVLKIVLTNIVCKNSLEYDFSFNNLSHWKDILQKWRKQTVQDIDSLSNMVDNSQEQEEKPLTLFDY